MGTLTEPRRRARLAVIAVLALALGLRLAVVDATPDRPFADPSDYDRHAVSIADGNGYPDSALAPAGGPTAYRPPGYPLALAGVYAVAGTGTDRWRAARIAQAVGGTITVALIALLALRLWGNRKVAGIALGLAAIDPVLAIWGAPLISEPSFTGLAVAGVLTALAARRSRRPVPWAAATGVVGGALALTRPNGALVVLPLVLAVWTTRPRLSGRALRLPAIVIGCAALTIAPWVIRNARTFHAFIPATTSSGIAFAGVYNEEAATVAPYGPQEAADDSNLFRPRHPGFYRNPVRLPEFAGLFSDPTVDELEVDRALRHAAADYAWGHPLYVAKVVAWNTYRLAGLEGPWFERLGLYRVGIIRSPLPELVWGGFVVMALLGAVGALTRLAARVPVFVWLVPGVVLASVLPIWADARYRAPLEPFVALLAAAAVGTALARRHRRVPTETVVRVLGDRYHRSP